MLENLNPDVAVSLVIVLIFSIGVLFGLLTIIVKDKITFKMYEDIKNLRESREFWMEKVNDRDYTISRLNALLKEQEKVIEDQQMKS